MRSSAFMTVLPFLSFLTKNFMRHYAGKGILWNRDSPFYGKKAMFLAFFRRLLQAGNIRKKVLSNLTILWKYG